MFCKNCGTENLDTQVECANCKTIINTNIPLNGTERVMIIGFFAGLLANLFFIFINVSNSSETLFLSILLVIVPILICIGIFYIFKKDKNIKFLIIGKKIFLVYILILLFVFDILVFTNKDLSRFLEFFITFNVPLLILYLLSTTLFFNILKKHEEWIIENGLFADSKNEKSFIEKTTQKIQEINKEPINRADELLKWAELKEKGLITDDEFQKAKEKILEGKL